MIKAYTSIEFQLGEWVKGNSVHNDERGECCPDFSCCQSGFKADKETRERFYKAHNDGDSETKSQMLGMFLGGAMAAYLPNKKIHIAGDGQENMD